MIPNPSSPHRRTTHRCRCTAVYCSNPLELAAVTSELSTAEWIDIFQQARQLGDAAAHFTGGEPLARPDLTELNRCSRAPRALYQLITVRASALRKTPGRHWVEAGLRSHPDQLFRIRARAAAKLDCRHQSAMRTKSTSSRSCRPQNAFTGKPCHPYTQNIRSPRRDDLVIRATSHPSAWRLPTRNIWMGTCAIAPPLLPTRHKLEKAVETRFAAADKTGLAGRQHPPIDFRRPRLLRPLPKACNGGWAVD